MLFKCGNATKQSIGHETGITPFDRLCDFVACRVNQLAQMSQDWFGKIRRFGDVIVYSRISSPHNTHQELLSNWRTANGEIFPQSTTRLWLPDVAPWFPHVW